MSLVGLALLISCAFLVLTVAGQVLIILHHRRIGRKYTLLKGVEHFSQLAAGFSLLLAVFALLYGAYSQEASTKEAEEMNRQSVTIAKHQTELMQSTVGDLNRVSTDLAVNADASVRAAHSLEEQLHNEIEIEGRKPTIRIAVAIVNPRGGEGTLLGVIDGPKLHAHSTTWNGKSDDSIVVRVEVGNLGDASLHAGSVNFKTASLDGLANPSIALADVGPMKFEDSDKPDPNDPFGGQDALALPFSNLATGTMKDYQLRITMPHPENAKERQFKFYIEFVGDAAPRSGDISFAVRFGSELDTPVAEGDAELGAGHYQEAFQTFSRSAEKGNGAAMRSLGFMYEGGHGIEQDCREVMRWYNAAIEQGDQIAMSNIGWLYERGVCVKSPDYVLARKWYERATSAGGADGMANLGYFCMFAHGSLKPNYDEAREWLSKAIFLGSARAMFNLAYMCEQGWGFHEKDLSEARDWYVKSAKAGYKPADAAVLRLQTTSR
jgi:Sel1 repeat